MKTENHFPSYEEFSRYDSSVWLSDIVVKPWRRITFLSLGQARAMSLGQKACAFAGLPAEANPARFARTPWVTYAAILLTTLVSILCFYRADIGAKLAFYPAAANRYYGLNFLSLFLVHGGWLHLLGNMYFLFIFGDNVEDRLGHRRFLTLLISSTLLATLTSFFFSGASAVPHVGASGGVFGIMVYYMLAFPRSQFTYCLLFVFFRVSASTLLLIYITLQLSGAVDQIASAGGPGTDFLAHLGGALGGVLGFLFYEASQSRRMTREFFDSVR